MEIFVFMFPSNLGMKSHHFAASIAVQYLILGAVIKGQGWDQELPLATVKVKLFDSLPTCCNKLMNLSDSPTYCIFIVWLRFSFSRDVHVLFLITTYNA